MHRRQRPGAPPAFSPVLLAVLGGVLLALLVLVLGSGTALASPVAGADDEVAATDGEVAGTDGEVAGTDGEVVLDYFYGEGCPFCVLQDEYLDDLADRYPELTIRRFEVWGDADNQRIMTETLGARGVEPTGVPATVLGERVWVGFNDQIAGQIDRAVAAALDDPDATDPASPAEESGSVIDLPLIGEVDLSAQPLLAATALIALVDGFNPCSLWVLTVLLAMVLNVGASRGRIFAVGLTFLFVTASIYGVFIAGLFSIFGVVGIVTGVAVGVGLLAVAFGAINVKDYLRYKQGVSLTIPDRYKPRIYRKGRAVRDPNRSLAAVLGLTVAMAAGVAIVELPCTAGFPVIWTGLVTTQGVSGAEFAALLGLYLLVYLLLELGVFALAVFTLQLGSFQERQGRILKLVGGVVMITLGAVLIIDPDVMDSFAGSTAVVLGSVGLAVLLLVVHRRVLPRLGIHIGDEQLLAERAREHARHPTEVS